MVEHCASGRHINCGTKRALSDKANQMLPSIARFASAKSAVLTIWICSGCASHTPRPKQPVQIVSQPTAAGIEVNGRYAGDAPIVVEVESSPHGRFWKDTIIKAYPKDTGYIQIKAFNGESRWSISDPIPSRISFDTRTDPAAKLEGAGNQ
jgi:hypothetical protein